jgi:hypothetical protein
MKIEHGRVRLVFQWLLSLQLALAIIHIVSFVFHRHHYSSSTRPFTVEMEAIHDNHNITSAAALKNQAEQWKREVLCREAFLSGAEPRPTKRQFERISPTLQMTWSENKCDELFCINAAKATTAADTTKDDDSNVEQSCQWSHFAIDNIMPKQQPGGHSQACDEAHVNEFYMDPKWDRYSFSDFFHGKHDSWKDAHQIVAANPAGSLMEEYYNAAVSQGTGAGNYSLLGQILEKRKAQMEQHLRPEPNTLLIHLRIGDVVDCAVDSVHELLFQQCYYFRTDLGTNRNLCRNAGVKQANDQPRVEDWNKYVLPLSNYSQLRLDESRPGGGGFKSIVIMGSTHQGHQKNFVRNATNSCLYAVAIRNYFSRFSNMNVTMRLAHPPDEDIIFASDVAGFIQSGGGFSSTLGQLARNNGGTVYSHGRTNVLSTTTTVHGK